MLIGSQLITILASQATRSIKLNIVKPYITTTKGASSTVVKPYTAATKSTEPSRLPTKTESALEVAPRPVVVAVKEDEKVEENTAVASQAARSTKLVIVKPYITATKNT